MNSNSESRLIALVVLCTLFVPFALVAETPPRSDVTLPGGDWLGDLATERLVIRSLYNRLAAYTSGSGAELKFEIGALQSVFPSDFERLRWMDMVSVPGGPSLDIVRNEHENGYTGTADVLYVPTWTVKTEAWVSLEEKEALQVMSVADALRLVAGEQPELLEAEALISYEVTAELGGRSRTYRAALSFGCRMPQAQTERQS